MDSTDYGTIVLAGLALVVAVWAALGAHRQADKTGDANELAKKAISEAEKATKAAEESALQAERSADAAAESNRIAGESLEHQKASADPRQDLTFVAVDDGEGGVDFKITNNRNDSAIWGIKITHETSFDHESYILFKEDPYEMGATVEPRETQRLGTIVEYANGGEVKLKINYKTSKHDTSGLVQNTLVQMPKARFAGTPVVFMDEHGNTHE